LRHEKHNRLWPNNRSTLKGPIRAFISADKRVTGMSAWIFIIGLVVLWTGVSWRLERRERRNFELAALSNPIKVAEFCGYDAKAARAAYVEKIAEHKNWRSNISFQLINWTTFGIGAALCVLGAVLWLAEDPTRSWDRLWDLVGPFVIAMVGIYYVYQLMKRLVKDNGQVNYSELESRLTEVEGKLNPGCASIYDARMRASKVKLTQNACTQPTVKQ
jgi:hypothetical protein